MTHTYTVDGITCNGCVAKVKHLLLLNPNITAADVSLDEKKAVVTMQRHLSVDELQDTLGRDTKYKIRNAEEAILDATADKSWLQTYKPLLIIAAFITGVSWLSSDGNFMTGMMHFMAGFFLVFSFFKLLDVKAFAESYAMYDVVARRIRAWGIVYPFVELLLGFAYLTRYQPVFTNYATIVVMGVSLIGVVQSVLSKRQIKCACLGAVFNLPMSTVTIVEDMLMIGMAVASLILMR